MLQAISKKWLLLDSIFHFLERVVTVQPWLNFWACPSAWERPFQLFAQRGQKQRITSLLLWAI